MADHSSPVGAGFETTLTRSFKAPIGLVFDCFTEARHFASWWGPAQCENEIYRFEVRPGGEISLRMAGPGYDHVMGGEFVEIDRPGRVVFLTKAFEAPDGGWGIINRNCVTFEERGGVTAMTLHCRVERAEGDIVLRALGGLELGWSQSLDRLVALVGDLAT